jgi:hypothetical protein
MGTVESLSKEGAIFGGRCEQLVEVVSGSKFYQDEILVLVRSVNPTKDRILVGHPIPHNFGE